MCFIYSKFSITSILKEDVFVHCFTRVKYETSLLTQMII